MASTYGFGANDTTFKPLILKEPLIKDLTITSPVTKTSEDKLLWESNENAITVPALKADTQTPIPAKSTNSPSTPWQNPPSYIWKYK